jgi:ArsR family transcriptional regulator, arsenate/arsenite/antimonite-responsive transcriptional repressor
MTVSIRQVAKTLARCGPMFLAMGEPARQQIILLLAETEAMNVSELTDKIDLSRPAVSHHLKVLRQVGLITARREGTENHYMLAIDDALILLRRFVDEVENCG